MDTSTPEYAKSFRAYMCKGFSIVLSQKAQRRSTHYIWRTRGGDDVRPSHAANDGKIFASVDPPPTGHPGEDYGCRCIAEPHFPEIDEHINIELRGLSDTGPTWSSQDFVDHYYQGNGRSVTLRRTGHHAAVAWEFMRQAGERLKRNHIARPARRAGTGSFTDYFNNTDSMRSIVFSLGDTTISGLISGVAVEVAGTIALSVDIEFQLNDIFEEPLDIGGLEAIDLQEIIVENLIRPADSYVLRQPDGPLSLGIHTGEPYIISDKWRATVSGRIYADPARSQF